MKTPSRQAAEPLFCTLLLCLLLCRPAHAYVDPGSGSFMFQLIAAGLFSALFSVKVFWSRLKGFLAEKGFLAARLLRKKPARDDAGPSRLP